jgi:hypothetical protein
VKACAGEWHSLFIKDDGSLWGMGWNNQGQLGLGAQNGFTTPTLIVEGHVVDVTCSRSASYFVMEDGSLWGMGAMDWNRMGLGNELASSTPMMIRESRTMSASVDQDHLVYIEYNGATLAAPVLSLPANQSTTTTQRPTLSWQPVAGANYYRLQVSTDPAFGELTLQGDWLVDTKFEFEETLMPDDYFWRVASIGEGGLGNWSTAFSFTRQMGVSINEDETLPSHFELLGNYPNPFNPTTTVKFQLAESAQVDIRVYDLQGRLVMSLPTQSLSAGVHSTVIDASGLSTGVYLYRLTAGVNVASGKMVLIK